MQSPMIASPLKQTSEIDWIYPLKSYIRKAYGDDPERYAEECSVLNRLRQDMRGAGKDNAAGRDLLYRYYGQLEFLDLRFPVDETHIKMSFTWFDAFTHKPTTQHSLAFEKASIIFNISAVHSNIGVIQNRHEDTGVKTAYHSFQAAAGMFTYINDNFLHAPSTDLNHDTVKTLINIMLAQAQEVFLEKTIMDGKKAGMLAKIASQASYLYGQAAEGVQENVTKGVFEKVWVILTQTKTSYLHAVAQYYQALADNDANAHGQSIARLQLAEKLTKESSKVANTFPSVPPPDSQLSSETSSILIDMHKKHLAEIQAKIPEFIKDNDFIYHQSIPTESSLAPVLKLPAAKPILVSELYAGQDMQRIIGPDIFQRIVPMAVTESASLYDEEKAKLVRAEAERVEVADSELATSLDYLKLPSSLNVIKDGFGKEMGVDEEFHRWCAEVARNMPTEKTLQDLFSKKEAIINSLSQSSRQLDVEESTCEKMRAKYGSEWVQQPSSRLTSTLRQDITKCRMTIHEASTSDNSIQAVFHQHEADFDEMRSAGEADEADVLYQRAMIKAGAGRGKSNQDLLSSGDGGNLIDEDFEDGSTSLTDQISNIEEMLRKLTLIKRERAQVLKDLKEKVHNDDIAQVLILNKRAITNQESQLFKTELEKFRPHQTRLLQANHKQASMLKDLTRAYSELLRDKRVRSDQTKYENFTRQRNTVLTKYKKIYQAMEDLVAGLAKAAKFYDDMKDNVQSLARNVESFVQNRKSEGSEMLSRIEKNKAGRNADQGLTNMMGGMNMNPRSPHQTFNQYDAPVRPPTLQHTSSYPSPYVTNAPPTLGYASPNGYGSLSPSAYGALQPPPIGLASTPVQQPQRGQHLPTGYMPPPPPGPPPQHLPSPGYSGYGNQNSASQYAPQQASNPSDPWAALSGWK